MLGKAKKIKSGDPMDPAIDVGTVIHEGAAKVFENRVNEAVAKHGAKLLHGNDRKGALYSADRRRPRRPTLRTGAARRPSARSIPIIRVPNDIDERDQDFQLDRLSACRRASAPTASTTSRTSSTSCEVGTVNIWEVPGYRIEMSPFGGIKDSGLGYKEGVLEAMKSFTNVKTYSLPWPG